MRERRCASGKRPDDAMLVPDFHDAFWNGDGIREIAQAMIGSYAELSWIDEGDYRIDYFWKQKGGTRGQKPVFGGVTKATGIAGHLTKATFHLWMAADHCRGLANYEFEAALFHQLLHLSEREIERDDDEIAAVRVPAIVAPDLKMFSAEVTRYGLWSMELRGASEVFHKQLKLDLKPRDTSFDDGEGDEAKRRRAIDNFEPLPENIGVLEGVIADSPALAGSL